MVFERQVQAAIHFWSFPEGSTCHKNMFKIVWQTSLTHDDGWGK